MAPLDAVSAHWSLFEFSQQIHDRMMNNDEITLQIITYSKISNACALFCFNIAYYRNIYKYLLFAVLDKTEMIIYESNIFSGFLENFWKSF